MWDVDLPVVRAPLWGYGHSGGVRSIPWSEGDLQAAWRGPQDHYGRWQSRGSSEGTLCALTISMTGWRIPSVGTHISEPVGKPRPTSLQLQPMKGRGTTSRVCLLLLIHFGRHQQHSVRGTIAYLHSGVVEARLGSCTAEQGAASGSWRRRSKYLPITGEATDAMPEEDSP
jgi:hypothetical protein